MRFNPSSLQAFLFWKHAGKFITFRFTGDSCTALEDFEQNPYNSSLSAIIPCHELLSAKPVFSDVSSGIYNLVDEVNACIGNSFVCETLTDSVFLSGLGKLQVNREAFLWSCLVSAILSQPHRSTNSNPKAALLVQFRCQRFLRYAYSQLTLPKFPWNLNNCKVLFSCFLKVFTCSDVSGNLHNFNSEPTECLSGYGKSGRMSDG